MSKRRGVKKNMELKKFLVVIFILFLSSNAYTENVKPNKARMGVFANMILFIDLHLHLADQ